MTDIDMLLESAIKAVDSEIEAVLENPSRDVLHNGKRTKGGEAGRAYYRFETRNPSLQYAESFKAELGENVYEVGMVEFGDEGVLLDFPEDCGETIPEVGLEWENDFILRKIRDELLRLASDMGAGEREAIERLFMPGEVRASADIELEAYDTGLLNDAQHTALSKAINSPVTFIWGPPGTGKTSTLGFIAANFLLHDKSILFVSNTNRAVDVGLLNVLNALEKLNEGEKKKWCTRYGELALENKSLQELSFESQIEKKLLDRKSSAVQFQQFLSELKRCEEDRERCIANGSEIPAELKIRLEMLGERVEGLGGVDALEERISRLGRLNEHSELNKKKLIATTLARVCTSDLFGDKKFDAVIVDEASMANLPYLLVMASRTKDHIVVVGDPMQLPPIATTNDADASGFLQQDIFGFVSGARTPGELFRWHDHNPSIACFFDTQYRLKEDLAGLISQAFYEGRLKTAGSGTSSSSKRSLALVNSSRYDPVLETGSKGRGFHPDNEVHRELVKKIIHWLVFKNHTVMSEIGVMVPFRNTVYDLRRSLYRNGFQDVEVGTIHTFQGREKEVIIFDTVMSAERRNGHDRHFSVRPFDEAKNGLSVPRLLNVAFSRSKRMLVVIADMKHIKKIYRDKFLGKLLDQMPEMDPEELR